MPYEISQQTTLPSVPTTGDFIYVERDTGSPPYSIHAWDISMFAALGAPMTGPLILHGAPVNPLDAATKAYVDAAFAAEAARAEAAEALKLPLSGSITMTGLLTLSTDPTTALHCVSKEYADASNGNVSGYLPNFGDEDMIALKGLTVDPRVANSTPSLVAGVLLCAKAIVKPNVVISQVIYNCGGSAAGLANCYIGIYSTAGVLLAATGNIATSSPFNATTHTITVPSFRTPTNASSVIIALLIGSGTTMPTITGAGNISANGTTTWGQDGTAGYPVFAYGSGLTALPASLVLNSTNCVVGTAPATAVPLIGLN